MDWFISHGSRLGGHQGASTEGKTILGENWDFIGNWDLLGLYSLLELDNLLELNNLLELDNFCNFKE